MDSTVVASPAATAASPEATVDSQVEATSAVAADSMVAVAASTAVAAADSTVAVGTANPYFSTSESPSASVDGLLFSDESLSSKNRGRLYVLK